MSAGPWDNLPSLVDKSVSLTEHEQAVLSQSVAQVVRNIFRREKNPKHIRILLSCVRDCVEVEAVFYATHKEATFKRKTLKKRAEKKKERRKKSC